MQGHLLEALVETVAEYELLQATGNGYLLQALIEIAAECELLQATGQNRFLSVIVSDDSTRLV